MIDQPASGKPRGISRGPKDEIYRDYKMQPQYLPPPLPSTTIPATTAAAQPAK